jgi:hypothetical protein
LKNTNHLFKRTYVISSLLLIAALILAACQTVSAAPIVQATMSATTSPSAIPTAAVQPTATVLASATITSVPTVMATQAEVQYGPTNFPKNVDPLTGLTVADPAILNRRPVMVKVSNFPREGRPHAGLSKADIVFDYSTGGGWNRYLALYYGQDSEQVGPIRSGRYVDQWLASMYQGVLGMMFAYEPEYNEIIGRIGEPRVINGTVSTCPAICDKKIGISEINWFANTAELTKYYAKSAGATNSKPNLDGMVFNTTPPLGGKAATELTVHFGGNNEGLWKYDSTQKRYLRWIDNQVNATTYSTIPQVDRNTNEQLAFSNVILVFASYTTLNKKDSMHKVALVGEKGKALIFRDGQVYEGIWKGVSGYSPLQFFDANNSPLELQPGNTWISIMGDLSNITQDQPGIYKVVFQKAAYQPAK